MGVKTHDGVKFVSPNGLVEKTVNIDNSGNPLFDGSQLAKQSDITAASAAGEVAFFARNTAPNGWLKANGATINRTTYAALFAAIGTTFGAGDGSTTFNIPDMRGYFPRAWDDGRGVDSGRPFGTTQADQLQSHNHGVSNWATNLNVFYQTGGSPNWTSGNGYVTNNGGTVGNFGTETRPKNISLLACIKY